MVLSPSSWLLCWLIPSPSTPAPALIFSIFLLLEVWHLWWGLHACSHQTGYHPSPLYVPNPGLGSEGATGDAQGMVWARKKFLINLERE